MRRPVGVKSIFAVRGTSLFSRRVATVAMLPSALSRSDFISLGACWAFSFQPVLPSVCRPVVLLLQSGTWARRLTQSPELGFGFCLFSSWNGFGLLFCIFVLRDCRHCRSAAVVQRFVRFSAHPQVMQQHRELSCGGDDGSLLSALSATLGQFQSPASQVTVDAERPQDVLRSLHQQRSQIGVSLFADMQLRLAPPRVAPSWLQSQIAAHVATFTTSSVSMYVIAISVPTPFTCFNSAVCGGLRAWLAQLTARTHSNVAAVALANKLARMAWAVLDKNEYYRPPMLVGAATAGLACR